MGLDIYAGPLCRYYAADWKTVIQQWGESSGVPVEVVTPGENWWARIRRIFRSAPEAKPPKVDPVTMIHRWRERVAEGRPGRESEDWEWPEAMDIAYETDRPNFDGWVAVQSWAAY